MLSSQLATFIAGFLIKPLMHAQDYGPCLCLFAGIAATIASIGIYAALIDLQTEPGHETTITCSRELDWSLLPITLTSIALDPVSRSINTFSLQYLPLRFPDKDMSNFGLVAVCCSGITIIALLALHVYRGNTGASHEEREEVDRNKRRIATGRAELLIALCLASLMVVSSLLLFVTRSWAIFLFGLVLGTFGLMYLNFVRSALTIFSEMRSHTYISFLESADAIGRLLGAIMINMLFSYGVKDGAEGDSYWPSLPYLGVAFCALLAVSILATVLIFKGYYGGSLKNVDSSTQPLLNGDGPGL